MIVANPTPWLERNPKDQGNAPYWMTPSALVAVSTSCDEPMLCPSSWATTYGLHGATFATEYPYSVSASSLPAIKPFSQPLPQDGSPSVYGRSRNTRSAA